MVVGESAMEAMEIGFDKQFGGAFRGKRVLVTGHTGFKGSWLSIWLTLLGASVTGYALPPANDIDNYVLCRLGEVITDIRGDIRNMPHLREVFRASRPEIVFHLAAQPIVRESYRQPAETMETNVMGTVNVLECIRLSDTVRAGVIVTSDKCYENREQLWGYRECDALGGRDPYSASKACAELVAAAYGASFFAAGQAGDAKAIATARAGNVIGGGDWSPHRILPDCARTLRAGEPIAVRNPGAVRPWQFVLEPLYGYLLLASKMLEHPGQYAGTWNFGPDSESIVPVGDVVDKVIRAWGSGARLDRPEKDAPHEAGLLSLDCSKAKALLGWKPRLSLDEALRWTVAWYKAFETEDVRGLCRRQVADYSRLMEQ
jgi:CDP-glucose 4,6-dehydratase